MANPFCGMSQWLARWLGHMLTQPRLEQDSCIIIIIIIQKAWDGLVATNYQSAILSRAQSTVDRARLLATASPHSGDWLHAPPITAVGLRLSDEAVRIAVAHRLGCKACEPHTCMWEGGRWTWAAWTLLPQKLPKTTTSQPSQRHLVESN